MKYPRTTSCCEEKFDKFWMRCKIIKNQNEKKKIISKNLTVFSKYQPVVLGDKALSANPRPTTRF